MIQRSPEHLRAAAVLGGELMLAPAVAAMRLPLLLLDLSPHGLPGREAVRATTEKVSALAEGVVAAQLSYAGSLMRFWPEMLAGKVPSVLSGIAVERSLHAALRPAGRRVSSNFRRLTRRA